MNSHNTKMAGLVPHRHFPSTEKYTYLNSAALGLIPTPVVESLDYISNDIAQRGALTFFDNVDKIKYGTYKSGAKLFSTTAENIIVSSGISVTLSQMAYCLRFGKGQNVVMIDVDIPAVTYPWLRLSEETGLETRFVRVKNDPNNLTYEMIEQLVDNNTAAICLSHVQWCTGHMMDLKRLSELAHANNALLIVDAMHTAGVMPLDANKLGVDIMVTGSYKWLCGYSGVSVCYLSPELMESLRPVLVGANSADPKPPYTEMDSSYLALPKGARKFDYGSSAHITQFTFSDSVNYLLDIGLDRIYEHNLKLFDRLAIGLKTMNADIITPLTAGDHAAVLTARFPGHDSLELMKQLQERNVIVSARLGGIRFSPHFFNDKNDIDNALSILESLLYKK